MSEQRCPDDANRWRRWSRIPPNPTNSLVTIITTDGQRWTAPVLDQSVNGLALLLASGKSIEVGQIVQVRDDKGLRNATITYICEQGLFCRVGLSIQP